MPRISPAALPAVGYGPASAADISRFAAVLKQSGGLLAASSVRTLTVGGRDVGGVAVYRTKRGAAATPIFQDQYVVQLLNVVAHSSSPPRFVRVGSQVVGLSTGAAAAAGWFQGDRVVLVYRQGATPDLPALAAAVHTAPPVG